MNVRICRYCHKLASPLPGISVIPTMASVYSIRPRPGAPVSASLTWDELHTGLDPRKFSLRTMRRLEQKGDLWQDIFKRRVDMHKVLNTMKDLES